MPSSKEDLDGHRRWNDRSSAAFFVVKGFSIGFIQRGETIEKDDSFLLCLDLIRRTIRKIRVFKLLLKVKSVNLLDFEERLVFQIFEKRERVELE